MTKEELETLYMDIYDNGLVSNEYKEKFKRYVNNRIADLEKENADLKKGLSVIDASNIYDKEQLTEAKELLNMFLRLHYNPIVDEHTLFCKVEQFLKEVEE